MYNFFEWVSFNYVEIFGFLTGTIGVWLSTKQKIWCWPVGLVNVSLYIYIFFVSKLYADFGLQIFYFGMTLYGWYQWLYGGTGHTKRHVGRTTFKSWMAYLSIGIPANALIGYLLATYTDAAFPYWDSFVSVWGIIGTYMQARKQIENWLVWIVIDMNCVAIYICKSLLLTSVLYCIFVGLAVYGYIQWKKDLKKSYSV